MRTVTSSEARQGWAEVLEAVRQEPVLIQRQKRDVAVVMSKDEYDRLVGVARFQRFCDRAGAKAQKVGMTEEILERMLDGEN